MVLKISNIWNLIFYFSGVRLQGGLGAGLGEAPGGWRMLEVVGEAGGRWRMLEETRRNRDLKEAYFQAKN